MPGPPVLRPDRGVLRGVRPAGSFDPDYATQPHRALPAPGAGQDPLAPAADRHAGRPGPVTLVSTVSRPGGRGRDRFGPGRGRSGLHRAGCWLTASRGDPQESATENRPPMAAPPAQVRVKRCGKSAPAVRATGGSANPTRSKAKRGTGLPARPGGKSPGRPLRWMATAPLWSTEPRL